MGWTFWLRDGWFLDFCRLGLVFCLSELVFKENEDDRRDRVLYEEESRSAEDGEQVAWH